MTMAELALWANDNGDATEYEYGSDPNNPLTWDSDRVHGCHCDPGYSGYDCSLVDCPVGDDPGTYEDHQEVQLLQCVADAGNFTISFRQAVTPPLSYNITAKELREALIALPTIYNVNVYFSQDGLPPNGTLNYVLPLRSQAMGTPPWAKFFPFSPTAVPTLKPTYFSATPSAGGTAPSESPSISPTVGPTLAPSPAPSVAPTVAPSHFYTTSLCRIDGLQVAIIDFMYTHGDLPPLLVNSYNLGDYTHYNGEPNTGTFTVATDGEQISGLTSIKGTTEVDVCNNRGLCDTTTGMCNCFETWTSSDGGRQGKAGNTRDCGYRNDHLYTFF